MNSRLVTIAGYLSLLGCGVILQIRAVKKPERLPTLGGVFTHVMRTRTGRVGVFVAWAWIGLHFFAR